MKLRTIALQTMTSKIIRAVSTFLIVILTSLACLHGLLLVGGGYALNDQYNALEVMLELESENLLHSPPDNISDSTKSYMGMFHSSTELQEFINGNHETISYVERNILKFFWLLLLVSVVRIYFKKSRSNYCKRQA